MSRISVYIPDDRWIGFNYSIKPDDGEYCIVLYNNIVTLCKYIAAKNLFIDVYNAELQHIYCESDETDCTDVWKVIGLPANYRSILDDKLSEVLADLSDDLE